MQGAAPSTPETRWRLPLSPLLVPLLTGFLLLTTSLHAQSRLKVDGAAQGGRPGAVLAGILARPYTLVLPALGKLAVPRDSTFARTLVVVGADVTLAGTVTGDVVVIGGNLFLRPGVQVHGRAMSFGGAVYPTTLGRVEGGILSFRDDGYEIQPEYGGGDTLHLHAVHLARRYGRGLELPGVYGVRGLAYDRVDGVSAEFGPAFRSGRLGVDPTITYRSHLGTMDPAMSARLRLGAGASALLRMERGTFTNDSWSRPGVVNSAATLAFASDLRNYWRAVRMEASLRGEHDFRSGAAGVGSMSLALGGRVEDARSVGPTPSSVTAPWAFSGGRAITGMMRANPAIEPGRIVSLMARGETYLEQGGLSGSAELSVELPMSAPGGAGWVQATVHSRFDLATFEGQSMQLLGHAVLTPWGPAPPQRWAYLGGGATIPTLDRLAVGGDWLLYLDWTYVARLPRPRLPLVGEPTAALRYIVGGAGQRSPPALVQNVGVGLGVGPLRVDLLVDPISHRRSLSLETDFFR